MPQNHRTSDFWEARRLPLAFLAASVLFGFSGNLLAPAIEEHVFQSLPSGIEESDVIVDITGGRKATTAGAFLAALPRGRRLEVVNPKKSEYRGRGLEPDDPMEIAIDYEVKRY